MPTTSRMWWTTFKLGAVVAAGGQRELADRLFSQAAWMAAAEEGSVITDDARIDVSQETSSICMLGAVVRELKIASDPEVLGVALNGVGLALARVTFEDDARSGSMPR